MKHGLKKRNQQGIALLSAVLIITIFAIMGMMNAQKSKESEKIAGSVVRYNTVFEAAEQSLRDATNYLESINGTPYVGNGSKGRSAAENFDIANIDNVDLVTNPSKAIIWDREILSEAACTPDPSAPSSCPTSVNFIKDLDSTELWINLAIKSDFGDACTGTATASDNEVACNNYLRDIETYTVIQELRNLTGSSDDEGNDTAKTGAMGVSGTGNETYYLITVKSSGFPPGTTDTQKDNPQHARENVILQGVFARL